MRIGYGQIIAEETSNTSQILYIYEQETTPGVTDSGRVIDSFVESRTLNRAYMCPRSVDPARTFNFWIETGNGDVVSSVIQLTVDPIESDSWS